MRNIRLGFDLGSSSLKIAVLRGGGFQIEEVRLPESLAEETETNPPQALTRFLKQTKKELSLPRGPAALALPPSQAICRLVSMPPVTTEQLFLNLTYEFSDFIQGEADRYHWDYAVCASAGDAEASREIPMMAAVAEKQTLAEYARVFARAGFRLNTVLPQEMALIQLCRARGAGEDPVCFVDLGHQFTRITVVWRDRVQATRQIALGGQDLDAAEPADAVPSVPSAAYTMEGVRDVRTFPAMAEVCDRIAVEILKVLHYYQFTYRSGTLRGIYLVGGGAALPPLRQSIENAVDLPLLDPADLLPKAGERAAAGVFAAGAAMRGT